MSEKALGGGVTGVGSGTGIPVSGGLEGEKNPFVEQRGRPGELHPGVVGSGAEAERARAEQAAAGARAAGIPDGVDPLLGQDREQRVEAGAAGGSGGGVRDRAAALGLDVARQYPDDESFLRAVVAGLREGAAYQLQLRQLVERLQGGVGGVEAAGSGAARGQTQGQAQVQGQAQGQGQGQVQGQASGLEAIFGPAPEWNPAWNQLIVVGPDGRPSLVAGADPSILPKFIAYQEYRSRVADALISQPEKVIGPLVERAAAEVARKQVEEYAAAQGAQAYVDKVIRENTSWLHQRDENGNVILGPSGLPLLTPEGKRFQELLFQAESLGIADMRAQERYAKDMMRSEYLAAMYRQQQAAAAAAAGAGMDGRRGMEAMRRASVGAAGLGRSELAGVQAANQGPLDLRDMLTRAFAQEGLLPESELGL